MNKIAEMLEQEDLPLKKINQMKHQARQEDAKNRNDFTVLSLYGECVDGAIVSYDPTPNQRAYADLRKKRMKCIRETDKTLAEDPSVALQAIYYAGVWSVAIPETITKAFVNMKSVDLDQACVRMPGRINDWFGKLFLNGSSAKNFENLRQLKVLEKFIPEFKLISEDICEERAILLRYLQNMFECCDVIANEKSPEYKPDFNLIYATFSYAAQLLKEHGFVDQTKISTCSAALFKHSFAAISQEKQRKLLLAAENNW
jgi:tRNA nucleotidyltransferase/poly(A) polymerase